MIRIEKMTLQMMEMHGYDHIHIYLGYLFDTISVDRYNDVERR